MTRGTIKNLSTAGLYLLAKDAIHRISSNYAGGNPDMRYIKKQEEIIDAVQDELNSRKS